MDRQNCANGRSAGEQAFGLAWNRFPLHPSEIAHRLIAESILDHLLSLGYLPNEYRSVETGLRGYFNMRWNRAGQLMDPDSNPEPDAAKCE